MHFRMDLLLFIEHVTYYKLKSDYTNQNNFCSKEPVNQETQENTGKTVKGPRGIRVPIFQGS